MGRRRRIAERIEQRPIRQWSLAVDRTAHRVDDTAQPFLVGAHTGVIGADQGLAAPAHALERRERHQQGAVLDKAHDFARHGAARRHFDIDAPAHRHGAERAGNFDQKTAHADDSPEEFALGNIAGCLNEALHRPFPSIAMMIRCGW
jgi:hypothetical protein